MTLTEFKRFADENNIVPISTEIYSQMISDSVKYARMKEVLYEIRAELESRVKELDIRLKRLDHTNISYTKPNYYGEGIPIRNSQEVQYRHLDGKADGLEKAIAVIDAKIKEYEECTIQSRK